MLCSLPAVQAPGHGPLLLKRVVKCHYNWKYPFLRPSVKQVINRYNTKFHGVRGAFAVAAAEAAAAVAAVPAAPDVEAPLEEAPLEAAA